MGMKSRKGFRSHRPDRRFADDKTMGDCVTGHPGRTAPAAEDLIGYRQRLRTRYADDRDPARTRWRRERRDRIGCRHHRISNRGQAPRPQSSRGNEPLMDADKR